MLVNFSDTAEHNQITKSSFPFYSSMLFCVERSW